MSQNSYLRELFGQMSQIVFLADLTVLRLITIVFLADLTVLQLITTVWAKRSQNSYLHEFCAQVS